MSDRYTLLADIIKCLIENNVSVQYIERQIEIKQRNRNLQIKYNKKRRDKFNIWNGV